VRKSELQKWKANLKEQLDKILALDEQILAELAADEKVTEEEIADEIERSSRLKGDAMQSLAEINERLAELAAPPAPPFAPPEQLESPPPNLNHLIHYSLPKVEVWKFNGKLGEWQEFWDSFESSIHLNDGLSNVDKFSYLRNLLLEPARSAIGGFALTSANYQAAVELLKKRYGKKIVVQRALVNELLNARPVFNE